MVSYLSCAYQGSYIQPQASGMESCFCLASMASMSVLGMGSSNGKSLVRRES